MVTVTVANVSGLAITPDAGTNPVVVPSQAGVLFNFTVTNTGNFANQVRFLASGASVRVVVPGTVTRAVIDLVNPGTIDAGDTDIHTNGADVISNPIAQNGFINVLVEVSINPPAAPAQVIQVLLGDTTTNSPSFDNQTSDSSANEVRTVLTTGINGLREARGDISVSVVEDALLRLTLTAPTGPVNPGSDITYTWQACNIGTVNVQGASLRAPQQFCRCADSAEHSLKAGQTFPVGTLYTISPSRTAFVRRLDNDSTGHPLKHTRLLSRPVLVSPLCAARTSI